MKKAVLLLLITLLAMPVSPGGAQAEGKIKIAATTSTIASLTASIAGEKAEIYTIASPSQNVHFISPTPKDVLKTRKADVFIHGGLDLEIWRGPLLNAAGKKEFISGERTVDVSAGIELLEAPGTLSRIHGDVHAHGNPHYSVDPEAAKQMTQNIADGLSSLYPGEKGFFQKNAADLKMRLTEKITEWQKRLAPFSGAPVVSYHNSWVYFLKRFHLKPFDNLEPNPGIPPTPRHIKELIERMKADSVKVIVRQSFNESGTPGKVAKAAGAKSILLSSEPGEIKGDYIELIEHNVAALENVLKK